MFKTIIITFFTCILFTLLAIGVFAVKLNHNQEQTNPFNETVDTTTLPTFYSHIEHNPRPIIQNTTANEIEQTLYYNFLRTVVPEEFLDLFYSATYYDIESGIELLGLAQHESQWRYFRGSKNNDGSFDHGPLMLNSNNIANENFMNQFYPQDVSLIEDNNHLYMVICINYYYSLKTKMGGAVWYALQIYNGGPRVLTIPHSSRLYKQTSNYANVVYGKIKSFRTQYETYKLENLDIVKAFLYEQKFAKYKEEVEEHKREEKERFLRSLAKSVNVNQTIMINHFAILDYTRELLYIDPKYLRNYALSHLPGMKVA